jgi:hypothetical protein
VKRSIARILFSLILGAITTVAVAWGINKTSLPRILEDPAPQASLATLPPSGTIVANNSPDWKWVVESGIVVNATQPLRMMRERAGHGYRCRQLAANWSNFWYGPSLETYEAGWPVRSMHGALLNSGTGTVQSIGMTSVDMYHPARPMWPGFLVDALFYAIVWLAIAVLAVNSFRVASALMRTRVGWCPRCGYDLRGALEKACSECGWNREETAP